jgi:hypothetical protein
MPSIAGYEGRVFYKDVLMESTDLETESIFLEGLEIMGFVRTSTDATLASSDVISFKGSVDGVNFYAMYSAAGTLITGVEGLEQVYCALDPTLFQGLTHLKLTTLVGPAADQTFRISLRRRE